MFVRIRRPLTILVILFWGWTTVSGQELPEEGQGNRISSLSALLNSINSHDSRIDEKNRAIQSAGNEIEHSDLLREAGELRNEKAGLERQFESVAGGVDIGHYVGQKPKDFDLQSEAAAILEPLFKELHRVTRGPREVEKLKEALHLQNSLEERFSEAVASVDLLSSGLDAGPLKDKLAEVRQSLERRRDDAANQGIVLENQLAARLSERESVTDNLRTSFASFVRSRGIHLVIGIIAFVAVYFLVRLIHRAIAKRMTRRRGERSVYARFIDVTLHVLAFVAAVFAILLVFIFTDDIVLLLLTAIFISGLAWGGIKLLPALLDELRMVLNLGPVREGERVIYGGLPWRVEVLGFQTILANPALTGGQLTMPVRGLVNMQSRPFTSDERWFPTTIGDWVRLEDPDLVGEVICQTPEYVELQLLGGTCQTLPATSFLARSPANLSVGFRVNRVFRIGHEHRSEATSAIPLAMEEALRSGLEKILEHDDGSFVHLAARLQDAGESSLDYDVEVDFTGAAAPRHEELERRMVGILIDLANREGWTIPCHQITMRQGGQGVEGR